MKNKILLFLTVAVAVMTATAGCSSSDDVSTGRVSRNGNELLSRSDSQAYINSLLDNNTFIDLDPSVPASLGDYSGMDSIGAQYRVALYRIYSATKIVDGLFKVDATAESLNLSPRLFKKYRDMLEGHGNTELIKFRAEGNDEGIRQVMRQFTPEAIESVIRPPKI